MRDECRLDLRGRDAVAGDLHDVVDAAHQPEVPVLVAPRAVAGEIPAGIPAPVRLAVALVVLVDAAEHRGPRLRKDEVAGTAERHGLSVLIDDVRAHTDRKSVV